MSYSLILKIYYFYTYKVALTKKFNCVRPKFMCWPPNSSVMVFGDGAFRRASLGLGGHEGRVWMMGFLPLQEETPESLECECASVCVCLSVLSLPQPPMWIHSRKAEVKAGKSVLAGNPCAGTWTPSHQNCENVNVCCWSLPDHGVLYGRLSWLKLLLYTSENLS